MSLTNSHLMSILFRALGKKAKVFVYVIGKMNNHEVNEWTELDLDDLSKNTKTKPKKAKKTLKWLKKHNLIAYRSKAMEVKPTATLLKAKPFAQKYMDKHKAEKGQEARQLGEKHSLTD